MKQQDHSSDLSQIIRAANSPEGKQLLALFQNNSTPEFRSAMEKASQGDYSEAQKIIHSVLSSPEAATLAERLGKNYGRNE